MLSIILAAAVNPHSPPIIDARHGPHDHQVCSTLDLSRRPSSSERVTVRIRETSEIALPPDQDSQARDWFSSAPAIAWADDEGDGSPEPEPSSNLAQPRLDTTVPTDIPRCDPHGWLLTRDGYILSWQLCWLLPQELASIEHPTPLHLRAQLEHLWTSTTAVRDQFLSTHVDEVRLTCDAIQREPLHYELTARAEQELAFKPPTGFTLDTQVQRPPEFVLSERRDSFEQTAILSPGDATSGCQIARFVDARVPNVVAAYIDNHFVYPEDPDEANTLAPVEFEVTASFISRKQCVTSQDNVEVTSDGQYCLVKFHVPSQSDFSINIRIDRYARRPAKQTTSGEGRDIWSSDVESFGDCTKIDLGTPNPRALVYYAWFAGQNAALVSTMATCRTASTQFAKLLRECARELGNLTARQLYHNMAINAQTAYQLGCLERARSDVDHLAYLYLGLGWTANLMSMDIADDAPPAQYRIDLWGLVTSIVREAYFAELPSDQRVAYLHSLLFLEKTDYDDVWKEDFGSEANFPATTTEAAALKPSNVVDDLVDYSNYFSGSLSKRAGKIDSNYRAPDEAD
jgi:hypothetical protein